MFLYLYSCKPKTLSVQKLWIELIGKKENECPLRKFRGQLTHSPHTWEIHHEPICSKECLYQDVYLFAPLNLKNKHLSVLWGVEITGSALETRCSLLALRFQRFHCRRSEMKTGRLRAGGEIKNSQSSAFLIAGCTKVNQKKNWGSLPK